ncbi:MAG: hypothetical protein LQ350_007216 [Teloschistes chrysophthalmus]|nr:MAG: hypothetical protein LQ350_007216 [Niorma chrysophthalma]
MDDSTKDHSVGSDDIAQDYVVLDTQGKTAYNGKPAEKEEAYALPEGWEETKTPEGRRYYLDHNTKTTSWVIPSSLDPQRISAWSPALSTDIPIGCEVREENGELYYVDHHNGTTCRIRQSAYDYSALGPLPKGWERRIAFGRRPRLYFVNHNDKTTTWDYPKHLLEGMQDGGSAVADDTSADTKEDPMMAKAGQ